MLTAFLPLVALVLGEPRPAPVPAKAPVVEDRAVAAHREAQTRLAKWLVDADSIESVEANGREISFVVLDRGAGKKITVRTTKRGVVSSLVVAPFPVAVAGNELGSLSWLGTELADTSASAIVRLTVDDEGAVLVVTDDARRYLLIPGRGSGGSARTGNAAVDARWAAAWNDDSADES